IPSPVSEAIYFQPSVVNLWLLGVGFGSVVFLFLSSRNHHNLKSGCRQTVLV
ncbi:hypothetical protein N311_05160, partial [Apaloderma vittatum]